VQERLQWQDAATSLVAAFKEPWMARIVPAVVLGLGLLATGCQDRSKLAKVPPPSLDRPTVLAPAPKTEPAAIAQAPTPKPMTPVPTTPPKPAPRVSDVPDSWLPIGPRNSWSWIVIHHSATPGGDAATFDRMHRSKGWDELGYHFVIGNGTLSRDGEIEVGSRWPKQKYGAHTSTADNRYNERGIGICLVGDFQIDRPSPSQTRSLAKLVGYLMKTYNVPASRVVGHGDAKPTECPGRNISVTEIRRLAQRVASGEEYVEPTLDHLAWRELLQDVRAH
jgi:hypothetical protein